MKLGEDIYVFFLYISIFILAPFSIMEYNKLKRYSSNKVYNHAKNSLIQAQKFLGFYAIVFIILHILYKILCWEIRYCEAIINENILGIESVTTPFFIKLLQMVINVLFVILFECIFSRIVYTFTEVKHISLYDSIGKINMGNIKAQKFFKYMVIRAIIMIVLFEFVFICTSIKLSIIINITNVLIVILGLADLLQNKDYYKDDYPKEREKLPFREKWYINNIYKYFRNTKYRRDHNIILRENLKNIVYGMLNIFSKC